MMTENLNKVAAEIIKNSICSAIYIDEKIQEIFDPGELPEKQKELAYSLRMNDCMLDFYKFDKNTWKSKTNYLFKHRDLVILDWDLEGRHDEIKLNALHILDEIVSTQGLHFCCIYTSTEDVQLQNEVIYPIIGFFYGMNKAQGEDILKIYEDILSRKSLSELDEQNLKNVIIENVKTILLLDENEKEEHKTALRNIELCIKKNEIEEEFLSRFDLPNFEDFSLPKLIKIGLAIDNNIELPITSCRFIPSFVKSVNAVFLEDTIVSIRSKGKVSELTFYNDFKDSVIQNKNSFLTLLSLELSSLAKSSSSFIGKEISEIDELALFFFQRSTEISDKNLFYETLKEIWKQQASSFLHEKEPNIFKVVDEYKEFRSFDLKKVDNYKANPTSSENLAKLNLVFNRLNSKRNENDLIRFGDIFTSTGGIGKRYFICITPHCDCIRPSKIQYNYFFLEGRKMPDLKKAVEKSDSKFRSFLTEFEDGKESLIVLDWQADLNKPDWASGDFCKPFTMHIPHPNISKPTSIWFQDIKMELSYLGTIKENFAQRISNFAFGYPIRVGVSFAQF